ncbi:uncharacterized protein LOC142616328 [Castanea sativa]|uniref:uncharacterized protein LOC142616328 n=1 Tax=Castanea sativa TaxID=21020 RepID=UPI003F64C1CC
MTRLPTVCAPIPGKPLKLYLATNDEAIGALIAQDDQEGIERPVYYVSRKLKDVETHYPRAERACLALIYAAQQLRHYLLAHTVQLLTKSHPIHPLLRRPVLSGRLAQWLLQLSEFKIIAITPTAVRGQAIADLLSNFPREDCWDITDEVPGDLPAVALMEAAGAAWTLRFDGSSTTSKGGDGIVLSKNTRETAAMSFKLDFPCTNNMAEYEAYLTDLTVAREMGIKHLQVIGDSNLVVCHARGDFALKEPSLAPYRAMAQRLEDSFDKFNIEHSLRSDNRFADALATLGSKVRFKGATTDVTIVKRPIPVIQMLKEEFFEQTAGSDRLAISH